MSRNLATVSWGLLALSLFALGSSNTALGQDAVLSELYGRGVHSYFAGRTFEAQESLTSAIDQGSKDPRCFYFRGLTQLCLGNVEAAEVDFKKGAELELTGRDRVYPVGRSLQRIQGPHRLLLEKYRREARVAARLEALKLQRSRYEERQRAEDRVLRDPDRARPPMEDVPPPPADAADPFSETEEETPTPVAPPADSTPPPAAEVPAPAPADPPQNDGGAREDPFGAPPADAPAPADPFGTPAAPAAPAPSGDTDPFGGDPFSN